MESSEYPIPDIDDDRVYEDHERDGVEPERAAAMTSIHHEHEHIDESNTEDLLERKNAADIKDGSRSAHVASQDVLLSSPSASSSSSSVTSSLFPLSPPSAAVHQVPRFSGCGLATQLYFAATEDAGMKRRAVWGLNTSAKDNLIWHPETGGPISNMYDI